MNVKVCKLTDAVNKQKLIATLQEISDVVTSTMGPNGKTCILYNGNTVPHVTKDGVTVSEFLHFEDPFKEAINLIIKETARRTAQSVGDGTTTSILLACDLCIQLLSAPIINTAIFLDQVDSDISLVIAHINAIKKDLDIADLETIDILKSIVKVSSNGDREITDLVIDTMIKIGLDGTVDVIESTNTETHVDIRNGMLIEAPAMLITRSYRVDKPQVLLVSGAIEKIHQFKTCMELANNLYKVYETSLIVIAKEFSKEIQNVVLINNQNKKFSMFLVESDGFGPGMLEILDDMGKILNCKILSTDSTSAYKLEGVTTDDLGKIEFATINKNSTVLHPIDNLSPSDLEIKSDILSKIHQIKTSGEERAGELKHFERRLSKYSKSATIMVGGITEAEKVEKKDRVDDAVHALYAAIKGGVVPGAGYALYTASSLVESQIITNLCKLPAKTLTFYTDETLDSIMKDFVTIDLVTYTTGDAFELGILDPADVQIKALEQASAIAKTILNTNAILIPIQSSWQDTKAEL